MATFIAYANFRKMPTKTAQRAVIRACREADLPEPTFLAGPEDNPRAWCEVPEWTTSLRQAEISDQVYRIYDEHLGRWL